MVSHKVYAYEAMDVLEKIHDYMISLYVAAVLIQCNCYN